MCIYQLDSDWNVMGIVTGTKGKSCLEEITPTCQADTHQPWSQRLAACHQSTVLWLCHGCHWQFSDPHGFCHFSVTVLPQTI